MRAAPDTSTALGHALDRLANGDPAGARALLDSTGADPQIAAAFAACLFAQGEIAAALEPLERAIAGEPAWPLHHWNHAAALHQLGDRSGCYHALRRFAATSDAPGGLAGDPEQPGRVAIAHRMLAEIERSARLSGVSLARPRKRRARS
jgi:predicted Zn-dependent protease